MITDRILIQKYHYQYLEFQIPVVTTRTGAIAMVAPHFFVVYLFRNPFTAESRPVGSLPLEETLFKSEKLKAHLTEAFPSEGKVAPQVTDEVSRSTYYRVISEQVCKQTPNRK